MKTLSSLLHHFLINYWDQRSLLLLGLSGGPDSMALFHLLLKEKVPFAVAHVNHGWRKESQDEAKILSHKCIEQNICYFEKVLSQDTTLSNLEDRARQERLSFFQELICQHHFQALLLAHHADDVAETVLKRLFEGANLHHLHGLKPVAPFEKIMIWRPLLSVKKEEILAYLQENNISYFIDHTNDEKRFLRGRLRKELFPYISSVFGKNVMPSLCRLAQSSSELHQFVEKMTAPFRARVQKAETMISIDLSDAESLTLFELKLILHDFFAEEKITLSSSHVEAICLHLKRRSAHKELVIGKRRIEIHHGQLYLPRTYRESHLSGEAL